MMYKLPTEFRDELRGVIGEITDGSHLKKKLKGRVVSVGDEVTLTLKKEGIEPDICIIDFKSRRKDYNHKEKKQIESIGEIVLKATNPPECISDELMEKISEAYTSKKKIRIEVEGEEDLAALPAILLAPDETTVLYGLPSKGIVLIDVKEKEKKIVKDFLEKMEIENGN